jgi:hypothetical protein
MHNCGCTGAIHVQAEHLGSPGKENKVGEKEDNLSNNLSTWSTLAAALNPLTYKPGGCLGVKGFTDALVVAGLGVLVRRGLS